MQQMLEANVAKDNSHSITTFLSVSFLQALMSFSATTEQLIKYLKWIWIFFLAAGFLKEYM